jgi:hypothetical protein
MLLRQTVRFAAARARFSTGCRTAISTAMMPMTMSSSMRVKALPRRAGSEVTARDGVHRLSMRPPAEAAAHYPSGAPANNEKAGGVHSRHHLTNISFVRWLSKRKIKNILSVFCRFGSGNFER